MIKQTPAESIANRKDHITVCICTFKRTTLLPSLITALLNQRTGGKFEFSISVVDNDYRESARQTVELFQRSNPERIEYYVEPEQNIALARNRAVRQSSGDFLAFIDDDEIPIDTWLFLMHAAIKRYGVCGVLGQVKPRFEDKPPLWVSRICERPMHNTGKMLRWTQTRTGNVLIRCRVFGEVPIPFDRQFGTGGEDVDFFRRMISLGYSFVWCNEAVVFELVPVSRWKRSFMLKRALLRGRNSLKHPSGRARSVAKSVIAVALYALILPFLVILGQYIFMKYAIKLFDHLGRVLAAIYLNPISEREM